MEHPIAAGRAAAEELGRRYADALRRRVGRHLGHEVVPVDGRRAAWRHCLERDAHGAREGRRRVGKHGAGALLVAQLVPVVAHAKRVAESEEAARRAAAQPARRSTGLLLDVFFWIASSTPQHMARFQCSAWKAKRLGSLPRDTPLAVSCTLSARMVASPEDTRAICVTKRPTRAGPMGAAVTLTFPPVSMDSALIALIAAAAHPKALPTPPCRQLPFCRGRACFPHPICVRARTRRGARARVFAVLRNTGFPPGHRYAWLLLKGEAPRRAARARRF